ncbi:MAG: patatin-like phospholipase family protein [Bacteroidetes bacterium]|nr:patatin-like phospholipase family protein [Bacteroidota bacterium]
MLFNKFLKSILLICLLFSFSSSLEIQTIKSLKNNRPRVGLVLSGGGTRGFAHLGVLKILEKYKIPIDLIVGTSMGSVLGGLYASGYTVDELDKILKTTNWEEVLSFSEVTDRQSVFYDQKQNFDRKQLTIRFDGLQPIIPSSFTSGQRMSTFINRLVLNSIYRPSPSFDNLKIPFRVVATDLITGKRIIIDKGNLSEAMRASISVPMLYTTVKLDSFELTDGGLLSNIPVEVAKEMGMDIIIAVDATSPLRNKNQLNAPWEVADQLIGIMVQQANNISLSKATVIIKPTLDNFISWESQNVEEIVKKGEEATLENINSINAQLYKNSGVEFLNSDSNITKTINKYIFSGNKNVSTEEVDSIFKPLINQQYSTEIVNSFLEKLLSLCRKKGLTLALIDSISFEDETGTLKIKLNEGSIDEIILIGKSKTRSWVINRELPFKTGQLFTYDKAIEGIQNLYSTNYFNQVFIDAYHKGSTSIVYVTLDEKETQRINLSIRSDNERQLRPIIDIRDENLLGAALELGGTFSFGPRDFYSNLEIKSHKFLDSYFNFSIRNYYELQDIFTYINDSTFEVDNQFKRIKKDELRTINNGFAFTFGRQMEKFGNINIGYRIENNKTNLMPQNNKIESQKFGVFNLSSFIDDRDKFPYSNEGSSLKLTFETSHRIDIDQKGYSRIFFEYEYFQKVFGPFIFHPHLTFGSGDETLPFNKFFNMGGENSFLGLFENDSRGRQLLSFQNEIRIKFPFKILFDTYLLARYDIGKVWVRRTEIKLKDFYHGFGGGISIDSPIGPASILFGRAFYLPDDITKPTVLGQVLVYLSIGYPL